MDEKNARAAVGLITSRWTGSLRVPMRHWPSPSSVAFSPPPFSMRFTPVNWISVRFPVEIHPHTDNSVELARIFTPAQFPKPSIWATTFPKQVDRTTPCAQSNRDAGSNKVYMQVNSSTFLRYSSVLPTGTVDFSSLSLVFFWTLYQRWSPTCRRIEKKRSKSCTTPALQV